MVKNVPFNAGDTGSIPGQGRSHMPWKPRGHADVQGGGGRGREEGGRQGCCWSFGMTAACPGPFLPRGPPLGAELTGMSAPGDGAGLLHCVACSTWVTSRVCTPCPPRVPTLSLTTGFYTATPLRCLPVTSLRSDWRMSSHLLDGKTEAW